ncbi:hypothetical protein Daus18300_001068 [Diaporthe australafricana]|uniref:Uncharacterized protein n=1 Tax=Diaporthe australafricana TaxID=127596 RepID=A0ABR3Y0B1_9PEZI
MASSKAAVTFISETLKLELQPLGVRVVTAMVGAIGTNLYENKAPFALPPDSYYKPIEGIIASQAAGALQDPNNEDVSVTAGNIMRDVVGGRSGQIWRGGEAGRASILSWLIPTKIRERILHQERGLYQLKKLR